MTRVLFWLGLFMFGVVLAGFYTAQSERKARNEKLRKIQRELARREADEKNGSEETPRTEDTQD